MRVGRAGRADVVHPRTRQHLPRPSLAVTGALVALTVIGAWARARGLTDLGLWRDDAWVALSARLGPRTALRMSATAPGFTLGLRSWLGVAEPTTSWWGQLVPLGAAVLGPPAAYLLVRVHGLSTRLGLVAAAVVAASPAAITYATRLKPYSFDLLAACLLLALAERARRDPARRTLAALVLVSAVAFACSASTAPVLVGAWAGLLADGLTGTRRASVRRPLLIAALAAVALGGLIYGAWYRSLPPGIAATWVHYYLDPSSLPNAWDSAGLTASRLLGGLLPLPFTLPAALALALVAAGFAGGLLAGRAAWAPALTVAAAIVASALEVSPLGTGRTDLVLYPALVLLGVLALASSASAAGTRFRPSPAGSRSSTRLTPVLNVAVGAVVLVAAACAWRDEVRYPGTDLEGLVAAAEARQVPGSLVVVEARTRYLWALTQEQELNVVFGSQWLTGFTVASTEPGVFLQPSYSVELGYTPTIWTERAAGATRILYLSTPFEQDDPPPDHGLLALIRAGWEPVEQLEVTGGRLVVLDPMPDPGPGAPSRPPG